MSELSTEGLKSMFKEASKKLEATGNPNGAVCVTCGDYFEVTFESIHHHTLNKCMETTTKTI